MIASESISLMTFALEMSHCASSFPSMEKLMRPSPVLLLRIVEISMCMSFGFRLFWHNLLLDAETFQPGLVVSWISVNCNPAPLALLTCLCYDERACERVDDELILRTDIVEIALNKGYWLLSGCMRFRTGTAFNSLKEDTVVGDTMTGLPLTATRTNSKSRSYSQDLTPRRLRAFPFFQIDGVLEMVRTLLQFTLGMDQIAVSIG